MTRDYGLFFIFMFSSPKLTNYAKIYPAFIVMSAILEL
jgi:hypothetical protein